VLISSNLIWSYCHVLSDCIRGLDWQLDLLDYNTVYSITVYKLYNSTALLTIFTEYHGRVFTRQGPGPPADPLNLWLTTNFTDWLTRKSKSLYDRWSVDQSVLVSSPIWGSWPDINFCLTFTVLSMSGALSDKRSGLSSVLVTWTASVQ
jgi:hypothetical protein